MFGAQPKINSNLPHDNIFVVKIKTVNYHILGEGLLIRGITAKCNEPVRIQHNWWQVQLISFPSPVLLADQKMEALGTRIG